MGTNYSIQELMRLIISATHSVAKELSDREEEQFMQALITSPRIYVAGAGRSGLVAKAFAMRLMHLGMESYVVGETITPAMEEGDLLVAFSGSGETHSITEICRTAKAIGGRLALLTSSNESTMAKIADVMVVLNSRPYDDEGLSSDFAIRQITGEHRSGAVYNPKSPTGSLFETAAMIFSDAVILELMDLRHTGMDEIVDNYSNIQ
jgi:6-phospho-3-hexuloisomerase